MKVLEKDNARKTSRRNSVLATQLLFLGLFLCACASTATFAEDHIVAARMALVTHDTEKFRKLITTQRDARGVVNGAPLTYYSIFHRSVDTLEHLLTLGADPNGRTKGGLPISIMAASKGYEKELALLIKHGADMEVTYSLSQLWPLSVAVTGRHSRIVQLLVDAGADLNRRHIIANNSVLHNALQRDQVEIAKILIDAGADLSSPNKFGQTPGEIAKKRNLTVLYSQLGVE